MTLPALEEIKERLKRANEYEHGLRALYQFPKRDKFYAAQITDAEARRLILALKRAIEQRDEYGKRDRYEIWDEKEDNQEIERILKGE